MWISRVLRDKFMISFARIYESNPRSLVILRYPYRKLNCRLLVLISSISSQITGSFQFLSKYVFQVLLASSASRLLVLFRFFSYRLLGLFSSDPPTLVVLSSPIIGDRPYIRRKIIAPFIRHLYSFMQIWRVSFLGHFGIAVGKYHHTILGFSGISCFENRKRCEENILTSELLWDPPPSNIQMVVK